MTASSAAERLAIPSGTGSTSAHRGGLVFDEISRVVALTAVGVLLILAGYSLALILTQPGFGPPGFDFAIYHDGAQRWLAGGPFYLPDQLAGPYYTLSGHVMYPPVTLALFVPFVYAPGFLWWMIPIGIVAWHVWSVRPALWAWVGIAVCLAWPMTVELIWTGNPVMWVVAAFALSFRWPWVGALVLLKPSLFPFAFRGTRTRHWWVTLAAFAAASLMFLPMWVDWLTVIVNARGPFSGPLYSLRDVPIMLIPLVALLSPKTLSFRTRLRGRVRDEPGLRRPA